MTRIQNRTALSLLLFMALLVWGGLITFTRFVPPDSVLAYTAFFVLLGVALTCTLAPIAYFIGLRFLSSRLYRATMRHALRQGALLSLCIVLNLLLRSLHSWNIFTAIVIFIAAIVVEVVSLGRK
jgi:hypothetical protein